MAKPIKDILKAAPVIIIGIIELIELLTDDE
jgi:hypothetical protein